MMTLMNEINSRKVHGERNVFKGLFTNPIFCVIWILTLVSQVLIVQFGGAWVSTAPLNEVHWGVCLACALGTLIWGQVRFFFKLLCVFCNYAMRKTHTGESMSVCAQGLCTDFSSRDLRKLQG
ncbi:unnamed protein product [Gongylonema pulchrum]|uniref:Cation-transporting P-type ATPase C-terminal domain-containing protein n=1 Tax=Gongylonema pulchrum TaxID=637853 RepID=A0A3P7LZ51_9BILA|nr:unnamed protein product [Gongylonema pulchrum]